MPPDEKKLLGAGKEPAAAFETAPDPLVTDRPGRVHWVVVVTRPLQPEDKAPPGTTLLTKFWHPRDHCWSENAFESLDHAIRLFVDESGWVLRQQQALDVPLAHELLFEARREDFSRPSTQQMLEEVGLTPEDVADLLNRVEREDEN
jgi:hypothetical protein